MLRVEVRGELLRWARDRAGLAVGDLIQRFPKIEQWESGAAKPTLKQLQDFAAATRVPFGYLFLPAPPNEPPPIPDFRTMHGRQIERISPDLRELIYACHLRQDWFAAYA